MISITVDTLVALAMILSAVVFMLGHAVGYGKAKDVETRRNNIRNGVCVFDPAEWRGAFIGRRYCVTHQGYDDTGSTHCTNNPDTY